MADKFSKTITTGSVDVSISVLINKTSDGTEQTALAWNTAGIVLSYWRLGEARTAITPATLASQAAAHSDGGFLLVDDTNQPGLYRLDVPDAAFATGAEWVVISAKFTSCFVFYERFNLETARASQASLDTVDDFLDNEVAAILAAVDTEVGDIKTKTDLIPAAGLPSLADYSSARAALLDNLNAAITSRPTVSEIWGALAASLLTANSIGKRIVDNLDVVVSTRATPTQVNTEVLDVLTVDTFTEPSSGAPTATPTLAAILSRLYSSWRNKRTETATALKEYNDAGTAIVSATMSDDDTTFTKGEMGAP